MIYLLNSSQKKELLKQEVRQHKMVGRNSAVKKWFCQCAIMKPAFYFDFLHRGHP